MLRAELVVVVRVDDSMERVAVVEQNGRARGRKIFRGMPQRLREHGFWLAKKRAHQIYVMNAVIQKISKRGSCITEGK